MTSQPAPPRRRWFQFSAMLMLLLVALVASLTAWLVTVEQATRLDRNEAIESEINRLEWKKDYASAQEIKEIDSQLAKLRKKHDKLSALLGAPTLSQDTPNSAQP